MVIYRLSLYHTLNNRTNKYEESSAISEIRSTFSDADSRETADISNSRF